MLIFSMGVSVDGFVADRDGDFNWTAPDDEVFAAHLARVQSLGAYIMGRRLYEMMRVWETDPAIRSDELRAAFAEAWIALPKVVLSRTLDGVDGNARLVSGALTDEIDAVLAGTDRPVEIGGPEVAGAAFDAGFVDELHLFRHPVVVGGGTPYLPPVTSRVALELLDTRRFDNGVILERYRRA